MTFIPRHRSFITAGLVASVSMVLAAQTAPARPAPKILIDQPPVAVQYQLNRLSADDLVRLERRPDDPKYRLVYLALLSRRGIEPAVRDGALKVLVAMDRATPARVILDALGKVPDTDTVTGDKLMAMLVALPKADLTRERESFAQDVQKSTFAWPVRGALAALYVVDGATLEAMKLAGGAGHSADALYAFRTLPQGADGRELRNGAFSYLAGFLAGPLDGAKSLDATVAPAFDALGWTNRDATTFGMLATALRNPAADASVKSAAIRSLNRIPQSVWGGDQVESLARAVIAFVGSIPPARRADPDALDAMQLGEALAAALPDASRVAVRHDLRALGVRIVRLQTIVEQMSYDRAWFVVEAGKPMQLAFTNREAMPHNVVIGAPGALEAIGNAGAAVPLPTDPAVKPYVPTLPTVLASTNLMKEGETARLTLTAPATPGEYVFLCTYPGHWVRMYGVMLVVPNLEAWEARPTVPTDPMTKQPFASQTR
ncbi:MAG: plastocyanin/azurin family copper-binding protein [Acidobacteriota bacterium]